MGGILANSVDLNGGAVSGKQGDVGAVDGAFPGEEGGVGHIDRELGKGRHGGAVVVVIRATATATAAGAPTGTPAGAGMTSARTHKDDPSV